MAAIGASRAAAAAAAGLGLLLAAGCSSTRDNYACPQTAVVGELAELVHYRDGPGRDLTDVTLRARVLGIQGECRYAKDGSVEVTTVVRIAADRGPANQERKGHVDYFVAILGPDADILAKEVFPVDMAFREGVERITLVEELAQRIPLADPGLGIRHRVLVGFQFDREGLDRALR